MKKSKEKNLFNREKGTTAFITVGFAVLILFGTLLLSLPISSAEGRFTSFSDSLFTATSATCVTGLSVVDTATYWSLFGQLVILGLIQIGGLGFMSLAFMLSMIIKRRISPHERMLLMQSYNINNYENTLGFVKRIAKYTFGIEFVGALLLSFRFIPDFGWGNGIYKSVFHSVSAFCNAGFDIIGVGNPEIKAMSHYVADPLVNITLMLLIALGGIGFVVVNDLSNCVKTKKRISVYTKIVLVLTVGLILSGALMFLGLEWNNPNTIGNKSLGEKILASFFHSVTLRTAGFSMIDNSMLTSGTQLMSMVFMFIGGASGSTAGGVKVVTVGVLVYTVICVAIGKRNVSIFGRKLSNESFMKAVTIVMIQFFLVILSTLIISVSMNTDVIKAAFESVSASGTVGLSLNFTPTLNTLSRFVIIFLMYFGRVGILSITYTFTVNVRDEKSIITYPEANLLIG
ncbi:MAG: Trk family potassium uptake protein [Clostridia bacterium]|nr:Trk family potassium uptake protein [Clostridia bacterium]